MEKKRQESKIEEEKFEEQEESSLETEEKPEEPIKVVSEPSETEKLKAEAEDYKRKWYSVTAEYENYRKRTSGEGARRYAEGRADVVKGLFPIADNLERALLVCADEATKKGISMVISSFEALLKSENIETVDPLGQPFDPKTAEAIMAVEAQEGEQSGIVKQVYRKGFKQGEKVLRFAQVVVIK